MPKRDQSVRKKSSRQKAARTATGKRGNPQQLAAAQMEAQEFLRERTEEGHRAAGRTPPSQATNKRSSGAVRKIDEDIRDLVAPLTEDAKLLQGPSDIRHPGDFTRPDTWRVLRI